MLTRAGHAIECRAGRCGRHLLCPPGALKNGESDDRVQQWRAGRKSADVYLHAQGQAMGMRLGAEISARGRGTLLVIASALPFSGANRP